MAQKEREVQKWDGQLENYSREFASQHQRLLSRIAGSANYEAFLNDFQFPDGMASKATRDSNGFLFQALIKQFESLFAGGADVWGPNKLGDPGELVFERGHYEGHIARYGIREHAMASISNGLAAYCLQAFVPITATFFVLYLYATPGVHMGALSRLRVIHIATHDSIQEGQNGPTHQADMTINSSRSELAFAVEAARILTGKGTPTRVVSMPCVRLFDAQTEEYKNEVISATPHVISYEPYVSTIWGRYCTASIAMYSFGYSEAAINNYARFVLDTESVVVKIERHVASLSQRTRKVQWMLLK